MVSNIYSIRDYLPRYADVTDAIHAAIADANRNGGGKVVIPAGEYLVRPIHLLSHVELHLEEGSLLSFTRDLGQYRPVVFKEILAEAAAYEAPIQAVEQENVSITGSGTIDANGDVWWTAFRGTPGGGSTKRPRCLTFMQCRNVLIEGINIRNSPAWTVYPWHCEHVVIRGISIKNPADSPNTDGINPDGCRDVLIENCTVDVGDDCVTLKSGTQGTTNNRPCEDIVVRNCRMLHGHGGIVIGSEMSGGVRNVEVSDCFFDGTDRGIRLKTRRKRGGVVENIHIARIDMQNVICPIVMNMYYYCGADGKEPYVYDKNPWPVDEGTPCLRDVRIEDITAKNARGSAGFLYGLPEQPIDGLTIRNLTVDMDPNAVPEHVAMLSYFPRQCRAGLFLRNARGVRLENITASGVEGPVLDTDASVVMEETP